MTVFSKIDDKSLHFSSMIGLPVIGEAGNKFGILSDLFVDYEEIYPQVVALQFKKNGLFFYVKWRDVISFGPKTIIINKSSEIGRSRTFPKVSRSSIVTGPLADQFGGDTLELPALGKVILDRQIVDTSGKKVVRVNDIEFIKTGQNLRITHAAIGLRSMIRRIGHEKLVDSIVKLFRPNSNYLKKESLINWKYVHAVPDKSMQASVRLSLSNEEISKMHPADIADILEDLDSNSRDYIFGELDPELAAETLTEIDEDLQTQLIKNESPEKVARIIENMGTDEAADILNELEDEQADAVIQEIDDDEIQEEIQDLLEYDEDSAGGLMSTEALTVHADMTKSELLKYIIEHDQDLESIYDIYVVDNDNKLLGTCSLREMLVIQEGVAISSIMEKEDIKFLAPDAPWLEVAEFMSKYNLINVPIVDEENILLGVISVDDILPWLLDE